MKRISETDAISKCFFLCQEQVVMAVHKHLCICLVRLYIKLAIF